MTSLSLNGPSVGYSRRSLLDLDELVLHTVIEAILDDVPSQTPFGVSKYRLRQPFVLAAICQPLRQFIMSRGAFWSKIRIDIESSPDLIEASISRSRSAPLYLEITQTIPGPDDSDQFDLDRFRLIVHRMGPRLVTLSISISRMDIFQLLVAENKDDRVISGGITNLRLTMALFATTIEPIHFVGPRTTQLNLLAQPITPLRLVDLLKSCECLKTLRLRSLSFDVTEEEIEAALQVANTAASGKRATQSLTHLTIFMLKDLEFMLKIILSFFPLTFKTASFIRLGPDIPPRASDYAILESHLDLTKMQGHNSRDVSLAISGPYYELKSADGQLRRQFVLFFLLSEQEIASPERTIALGLLRRVAALDLKLETTQSILQWLDLWRRDTFPELRSIVVHLTVDLTGDSPSSTILESAEQNSLKITAPRLEKVTFEWEVTGMVHGDTYDESDPTVQSWAQLCRVVLGAFTSTSTITIDACSNRELTFPPSLVKKAILSC